MTDERIIVHVHKFIEAHNYDQAYELARTISDCETSMDIEMLVSQEEKRFFEYIRH